MKSEYRSNKSVAKNPTVSISADDPRVAWNKIANTKSRIGAEIDIVGLDGKSLITGGTQAGNASGSSSSGATDLQNAASKTYVPPSQGNPGYLIDGFGAIIPTGITNLETSWSGNDLVITFDWDYEDEANGTVSDFVVELTGEGETVRIPYGTFVPNKTQTQQTLTVTKTLNENAFSLFTVNISSVCVYVMDAFYNKSTSVCDTSVPTYVLDLPTPVITVSPMLNGYKVEYTTPTQGIYDAIEISEYESENNPGNVTYNVVFWDQTNPAIIVSQNTSKRWVRARFSSGARIFTDYCLPVAVTPINPVTVDDVGPANVASVTTTGSLDKDGIIGFNGHATISWTPVTGGGIRGYRIRWREVTAEPIPYSYVDSPGTATTYHLSGLGVGLTYEIAVATYDEFNNTSTSYISGANVTINGTPYIAGVVNVSGYFSSKANSTDLESTAFKFGYGVSPGKRGLFFNSHNYWYIDSDQSALLKLGGNTSNYISWDGSLFSIDGDIIARGGYFAGNIELVSGGSLYSGAHGQPTGNAGFILNNAGLRFDNGSQQGITQITASTGLFTTTKAKIANWDITSDSISKTTSGQGKIDINSGQGYIATTNTNFQEYHAGINAPTINSDSVFWAGRGSKLVDGSSVIDPNAELNAFRVTATGSLYATNATIDGTVRASLGGFGSFDSNNNIIDGWTIDENGIVAAGAGRIKVGNYSIKSNLGSDFIIYDDTTTTTLFKSDTVTYATDPKRIYLGDLTRHVEVAKSAQVSGAGSVSTMPSSSSEEVSAYRSGGLRNMFTVASGQLTADGFGSILEYPSSFKGDVLIVYDPNDPNSRSDNPWRKITAMYLNTKGVSGTLYYYAQYTVSNGVCTQFATSTFSTYNLPTENPILPGQTTSDVFLSYSSGSSFIWAVYSNLSAADAVSRLNAHAVETNSACVPGKFIVPNFVGQLQPPSTSDYIIAVGNSIVTTTSSLWGTVASQSPAAGTQQDVGSTIIVDIYVSSETTTTTTTTTSAGTWYLAETTVDFQEDTCVSAPVYVGSTTTQPAEVNTIFTISLGSRTIRKGYYSTISGSDAVSNLLAGTPQCSGVTTTTPTTTTTTGTVGTGTTATTSTATTSTTTSSTTTTPTTTTTTTTPSFIISSTSSTSNSITFAWSNPPAFTAFYGVQLNSGSLLTTTSTSYTFSDLSPSTSYTVSVYAKDSSNATLASDSAPITTSATTTTTTTSTTPTTTTTTTSTTPTTTTSTTSTTTTTTSAGIEYYDGTSACNGPSGNYYSAPSVSGPYYAASIPSDTSSYSSGTTTVHKYRTTSAAALDAAKQAACEYFTTTTTASTTTTTASTTTTTASGNRICSASDYLNLPYPNCLSEGACDPLGSLSPC